MDRFGFVRVSAVTLDLALGNPDENAARIIESLESSKDQDLVVFPENALTGYTVGDLYSQDLLLESTVKNLIRIAKKVENQVVVVGAPLQVGNALFNCACVLNNGNIAGIIHKSHLPNYKEFYEGRWFKNKSSPTEIKLSNWIRPVPFGTDLLFKFEDLIISGEICEDLFMPIPPSSHHAIAGATILFNCSASPEQIGKQDYRRELVSNQSGRCVAGYVYVSSGPSESSSDLVFGGDCLIYENGNRLASSGQIGDKGKIDRGSHYCSAEIDYKKLLSDRRKTTSFFGLESEKNYRIIPVVLSHSEPGYIRNVDAHPFVPSDGPSLHKRCAEVFGISSAGLCQRLSRVKGPVSIGISGGLDSTLAVCSLLRSFNDLEKSKSEILAFTMPGFGTTVKTKSNAHKLMELLGVLLKEVDIRPVSFQSFVDLQHKPFGIDCVTILDAANGNVRQAVVTFEEELKKIPVENRNDLVFENVQARHRTSILMNAGTVIGTGDMSEIALGWCTYNGDHMSMYNPNCSIPKTLVKFLVEYIANNLTGQLSTRPNELKQVLLDIANTTISPELLPPGEQGEIVQSTEEVLGPYELHDFFLYHFIRNGFSPQKILYLAEHVNRNRSTDERANFSKRYTTEEIKKWLRVFYDRFFWTQFKRNCVPDGPKVGSVSLSPRGDWRMPSDADPSIWIAEL